MAFQENLQVEIETIFNSAGFDKLQAELKQTRAQMAATFGQVKQMRAMRREADKFADTLQQAGLGERGGEGAPFFDVETGAPVNAANGVERMADALDRAEIASAGFSDNVGASNQFLEGMRGNVDEISRKTSMAAAGLSTNVQDSPMGLGGMRQTPDTRSMFGGTGIRRFLPNMARLREVSEIANIEFGNMKGNLKGLAGNMKSAAGGTRALQMRLLGLQFTMLTVAFVFGGLMASALGAVGVFKVLGNTLKFFFLPTALNVLDAMLGFQSFMMGVDKETRQLIGDIFLWISALAVAVGILAALGKAVITVFGMLTTFAGILSTVGGYVLKLGQALKMIASGGMALIASFLAGIISSFLVVIGVAKKFGKVAALVVGGVLVAIGALVASIASIPVIIAAAVGVIVGAVLGVLWSFRDTIKNIFESIWNIIVGVFEGIYNILVGNSIIPDLVNSIINWFMKLPKMALQVGKGIVNALVKGIKGIGSGIWNAFKQVLPDFLVDALEGVGNAVGGVVSTAGSIGSGIANTVGNLGSSVGQAAGNFASGIGSTVGSFFGGGNNQGGASVQNNNINAEVQVNDKEETPQETGRKFGQGLSQGLNQRSSNITSGT